MGGGKNGESLGSVLPIPAGCASALSTGKIWMPIRHLPIGFCAAKHAETQKRRNANNREENESNGEPRLRVGEAAGGGAPGDLLARRRGACLEFGAQMISVGT